MPKRKSWLFSICPLKTIILWYVCNCKGQVKLDCYFDLWLKKQSGILVSGVLFCYFAAIFVDEGVFFGTSTYFSTCKLIIIIIRDKHCNNWFKGAEEHIFLPHFDIIIMSSTLMRWASWKSILRIISKLEVPVLKIWALWMYFSWLLEGYCGRVLSFALITISDQRFDLR